MYIFLVAFERGEFFVVKADSKGNALNKVWKKHEYLRNADVRDVVLIEDEVFRF